MATGDVTKLPKWAQQRIEVLERDLERAHKQLAEGPADSRIFADPYIHNRPLGEDEIIRFHLREGFHIDARLRGERLEIHGVEQFVVAPRSSNVIEVREA